MQEKVEIITNHFEQYRTKIPKNGYCVSSKLSYHWTCCCKQQKRGHGNKLLEPQEQVSRLKSLVEKNM